MLPGMTEQGESPEAIDPVLAYVQRVFEEGNGCSVCGQRHWSIGDLVEARTFQGGDLVVGGSVYVFLPVVCDNCGNTVFFNAVSAGLLPNVPGGTD